jgi:hypothetical protein
MSKPQSEIRQSQIVTTFGPGAMADLPNHSVLIAGLEFWSLGGDAVSEPRLSQKLAEASVLAQSNSRRRRRLTMIRLRSQPVSRHFQFPEWFITQYLEHQGRPEERSRLLVHRKALTQGKFIDRDRKRRSVVPVRFVRACRAGHIGDIDWYAFSHNGPTDCAKQQRQLYLDERGTSGDLTEVWVPLRMRKGQAQYGASGRHRQSGARSLRWRSALARPFYKGNLWRTQPAADPLGIQRLLPPVDERDLASRSR